MDRAVDLTAVTGRPSGQPSGASVFRFSTADYQPRDRLAAWCEVYGKSVCKYDIEPIETESVDADVVFQKFPDLGIMTGYRSPAVYRRSGGQLDNGNVFVTVGLSGRFEAAQLGRSASMAAGDAFIGTGAEPIVARIPHGMRSITLSVPSHRLAPAVSRLDSMFARRIPADDPALRLLTRYLGIIEEPGNLASPELQRNAVTHVHDLLVLTLGATRDAAETARLRGARAARLREIKADIERNLCTEDLSVVTLAARHRLPVRYVQRLFEAEGVSFTEFVLERRLARVHRLLIDQRLADRPIGIIAFEAGFTNQPYFNRAFRARFGTAPSDVRAQARRDG